MSSSPATARPQRSRGGTGLMLTIAAATVVTVALEAAFMTVASWLLLPFLLLVVFLMAVVVVRAVLRVLEDGTVATAPAMKRPVAEPRSASVASRPALGH